MQRVPPFRHASRKVEAHVVGHDHDLSAGQGLGKPLKEFDGQSDLRGRVLAALALPGAQGQVPTLREHQEAPHEETVGLAMASADPPQVMSGPGQSALECAVRTRIIGARRLAFSHCKEVPPHPLQELLR